jgi:hypothetical protein
MRVAYIHYIDISLYTLRFDSLLYPNGKSSAEALHTCASEWLTKTPNPRRKQTAAHESPPGPPLHLGTPAWLRRPSAAHSS